MKRKQMLANLLCLGFLLGVHNGQIALWKDQDPIPAKVFPYSVSELPVPVQLALRSGIPINGMEDVERLLEKYLP